MKRDLTLQPAAIITGGGRGIGRTISLQLSRSHPVLCVGRTSSDLVKTCETIRAQGGTAEFYVGDVANQRTAREIMLKLASLRWTPRTLVCNAGIGKSNSSHELAEVEWRETFDVNVHGSFYLAKAVLPSMKKRGSGTLCFMSSIAGIKSYAYEAAYVASKHATVGLANTLAAEYGKYGITSVAICPGFVEGTMTTRTIKSLAARQNISESEARKIVERANSLQRIIPAQEVAEVVDFVASGKAPSLSGAPLIMGGM
jgi:NAD(P)-dependent dehydrogenase (short-subunit alcohol dehydrogenase family)